MGPSGSGARNSPVIPQSSSPAPAGNHLLIDSSQNERNNGEGV